MNNYLTVKQLREACIAYPYILAQYASGYEMGINSKVASIAAKKQKFKDTDLTAFIGFTPCGLNEYINHKGKFA